MRRPKSACWIFSPAPSRPAITPGAGRRSASRARPQAAQPSSGPARLPRRAMRPSPTRPWATAWCARTCTPPASRHHGVVIWPTLLALSERTPLSGMTFLGAAIIGYEAGAQIGRALVTADLARLYRPTGLVGPLGAALAGSYALGLAEDAATSALAIAANTSSGLNEWPRAGGSEMYFHPGFAARNAIAAIELAEAGARASETILEGEAGLFAAFRRQPAPAGIRLFAGPRPEIMAVYNKPAPPAILPRPRRKQPCAPRARSGQRKISRRFRSMSRRPPPAIPAAIPRGLSTTRCRRR